MGVLEDGPRPTFRRFESLLREEGLAADEIVRASHLLMAYYGGNDIVRDALRGELVSFLSLESRWYDSLAAGTPDYSIYQDPIYLADAMACWLMYSRGYLRAMQRYGLTGVIGDQIRVIADLGCGIGFTSLGLAELFPAARVYGTNFMDSPQARVAERAGVEVQEEAGEADMVLALEYFEHVEAPVDHLRAVLRAEPSVVVVSNTFGPRAPGHFGSYVVGGVGVEPRRAARAFDTEMKDQGYKELSTRMWNGRPAYWIRGA
jgi:hypothetical protein